MKIDKELVEAIKNFEKAHKSYLDSDGSLNESGWNLLHDAEVNWGDDPKWHDYEKFHLQPRHEDYWFNPEEDLEYKRHWKALHPALAKKVFEIET